MENQNNQNKHENNNNNNNTTNRTQTTTKSSSNSSNSSSSSSNSSVRSRWTPKPEQILILESIFDSGMVNPPKEETIRIRKLLEQFGPVGDANVFYWFQNRRSRSRRRQRQLLAAASEAAAPLSAVGLVAESSAACFGAPGCYEGVFGNFIGQMGGIGGVLPQLGNTCSSSSSATYGSPDGTNNIDFTPGTITVFINGIATQVPEGPLDVKTMFGEEVTLFHSSGLPVPSNEFGFSFQSLQHGESYFLVC